MSELIIVLCLLMNLAITVVNMFLLFNLINLIRGFEDDPEDPAKEDLPVAEPKLEVINFRNQA